MKTLLASTLALLLIFPVLAASTFDELEWQTGAGEHQLPFGNAVYNTSAEDAYLDGDQTRDFTRILQGHELNAPDAVVYKVEGPQADAFVEITFSDIGFVKMDDWEDEIDPDAILKSLKEGTEEANEIRDPSYAAIYVDGWTEEPFLDRDKAIVYWAINGHDSEGGLFINAKALKLGRKGYTELLWVGSPDQFQNAAFNLDPVLANYQFIEGSKYADFNPDLDTVAAVGASALAFKLMTGKAGAGLLAVLLVFAKKFWFLIFLPFVALWKKLTGKKEEEA